MRALVVGGTGFIGGHLVRHLWDQGERCRVLARPTSDLAPLEGLDFELVRGDLGNPESLRQAVENMEVVYNLAGIGHVTAQSQAAYERFHAVNVAGVHHLAQACLDANVKQLVHLSSTAAMGLIHHSPIDETATCRPATPYQMSKWEGEQAALGYWESHRLPVIVLRPCMVYGPGGYGEFARFCRWFAQGVFPRVGWGPNLTPLVHVSDVVQAVHQAALKGHPGQVYLVAGATSPPLAQIRQLVLETLGIKRPYIYAPRWLALAGAWALEAMARARGRPPLLTRRNVASVTASRVFDIGLAARHLGYAPQVPLAEGVRETVLWYRESGYL